MVANAVCLYQGVQEITFGEEVAGSGLLAATTGVLVPESAVAVVAGGLVALHGAWVIGSATGNSVQTLAQIIAASGIGQKPIQTHHLIPYNNNSTLAILE
jgi:hypothetical protein